VDVDLFRSVAAVRLIFILGIVNLVTALLIFFSCRCIPVSRIIGKALMKQPLYRRFNTYHCYIWPVFWASVIIHAFFAIMLIGWPF